MGFLAVVSLQLIRHAQQRQCKNDVAGGLLITQTIKSSTICMSVAVQSNSRSLFINRHDAAMLA